MSKLLARAHVKFRNAEFDYTNIGTDDAFLDDCCYNLQQCIEFALKYIVEMNGENYVENHDVRSQLNKLKTMDVELPFFSSIRRLASTLNDWEAESRYNDDFTALIEDVEDARRLAREMLQYCDSLVQEI
ncbi:MAG: HEPN domain-containing protein [Firmicutes bacterium]|jgi:HEPN domain-containing protein|nr:HEPN domain-containing protein [Bacillota bacterium]MBR6351584.1 HEPN domain-containing protein [Bacillota bacterium]